MGSDSQHPIPLIIFSSKLVRGTDEWDDLCKKVREACETYGCFEMVYEDIPPELTTELFSVGSQLFTLPLETKKTKNYNPNRIRSYITHPPFLESFGFEEASKFESVRKLTEEKWPNSDDQFCTISTSMKHLRELKNIINSVILDMYGLGENASANLFLESQAVMRLAKYVTPASEEMMTALLPHTDKTLGSILVGVDDHISGLQVETKDGQWFKLSLSPNSLVFLGGDILMAWSNGRMHSVKHRVMISGERERYSFGIFEAPTDGVIIKAQTELVDEKCPRMFKDFNYAEFTKFANSAEAKAIEIPKHIYAFAGIST